VRFSHQKLILGNLNNLPEMGLESFYMCYYFRLDEPLTKGLTRAWHTSCWL